MVLIVVLLCLSQAPPPVPAPVSAQAAGARSWAQASVTHGAQGDGEYHTLHLSRLSGLDCIVNGFLTNSRLDI